MRLKVLSVWIAGLKFAPLRSMEARGKKTIHTKNPQPSAHAASNPATIMMMPIITTIIVYQRLARTPSPPIKASNEPIQNI